MRTINVAATIDPGADNDVILVGSLANEDDRRGHTAGRSTGIESALSSPAARATTSFRFDDTGDISANSGVLTRDRPDRARPRRPAASGT